MPPASGERFGRGEAWSMFVAGEADVCAKRVGTPNITQHTDFELLYYYGFENHVGHLNRHQHPETF